MTRPQKTTLPAAAIVVIGLALFTLIGVSGAWYILLAKKADQFISPIESQLSGDRYVHFTLLTRTGALRPALQFDYDTIDLAPSILPFVKVSILGEVIESSPESKWFDEIAGDTQRKPAEHDGGLNGLQP